MTLQQQNIKISVERLLEQEVDQISRNGEETYIKPFTISEELSYFASKIDFHGTHEDVLQADNNSHTEERKEQKEGDSDSNKESRWSWETVHSKLRIALSEVCVMLDVLECLHRKKYLVLDPIQQNPEPNKQTVQMFGSRKCLAQVGAIIAKGAGSLCNKKKSRESSIMDTVVVVDEEHDDEYYMQLMHLRQYWRVKKTGVQITGDVTYRSAGSQFWHPGLLEVKAAHDLTGSGVDHRKLVVNISPDLMQQSRLTVEIFDHGSYRPWVASTDLIPWEKSKTAFDWENNLQLAQMHLFNLEIFSLLSNDAFQGSYNSIEVLDARICCRILDKVEVFINHHVGEYTEQEKEKNQDVSANDLTLLLNNLLLNYHARNIKSPSLYPATSNHQQKPMKSSSVHNLLTKSVSKHNCILKDFIEEAKHKVCVTRLMNYLDEKSKSLKNSVLLMHWNVIKYRLLSSVTLLIITKSYAITITTSILLTIDNEGFKVTFENAEKLSLPFDLEILQELLDLELKNHMLKIANSLCVQHEWFVIQSSPKYSAVTGSHNGSLESGSIFYSPKHHRFIRLYVYNINDVEIGVSVPIEGSPSLNLDEKFKWLNITYSKLPCVNLPGRTFAEKMEALFLCK